MTPTLSRIPLPFMLVFGLVLAATLLAGCQSGGSSDPQPFDIAGMVIGESGLVPSGEAQYVASGLAVAGKAYQLEQLSPENEHYIGRAVAARLIARYGLFENETATQYVNLVGQSLAMGSDAPETFGGYKFIILDSDDVNAFAAPGGYVLVTRGMLRLCKSEDAFAAVLAHEVAHVQNRDGLNAIKTSQFWGTVGHELGKNLGDQNIPALTEAFGGLTDQFVEQVIVKGYSRDAELRADRDAVKILQRVGYDSRSMMVMLDQLNDGWKPGIGMVKTHPSPDQRLAGVRPLIAKGPAESPIKARLKRFNQAKNALAVAPTPNN